MVRVAIYPGTFDPVTNGHLDILQRAISVFDRVIIAVASDSNKSPLFTLKERVELLYQVTAGMPTVTVVSFDGLTVEFAHRCGAVAIIRGLRAMSDFEYEFQLALMNKKLAPDIETVFLMTKSDFSFISSSAIKWAASLNGAVSDLVPPVVEKALIEKYARERPAPG
ncbi:pantetheine-phosphate adenylyltransferase [Acididesulfobacillus acetoxydans]|uniref:Phosphopantetheine adenylyltransferase n=1 Tax=Acididesulfobacillus acetoxydans TaxID=1561005 RepID=A0A8S0VXT2_9FIRM|nr:pantetheine-phosphate adenylyltransferase [Acididesulfobacillus acetoxydans]CAA7602273.1 pantetheine-phosphate adenylyltransferase [Acididesulfobacillus acetoxydans]CEJ07509.1 Phosphopantetheine adenylyltransferase [Acididesulfobacillus acetoxydans]